MVRKIGTTSLTTKKLIADLKSLSTKEKAPIWKRIAYELERPARQRRSVNIYKIEKHVRIGETALIPGKVLSEGELTKKLTIAAFSLSEKAKEKINKVGKAISIRQLMKDNPKGNKVRILG